MHSTTEEQMKAKPQGWQLSCMPPWARQWTGGIRRCRPFHANDPWGWPIRGKSGSGCGWARSRQEKSPPPRRSLRAAHNRSTRMIHRRRSPWMLQANPSVHPNTSSASQMPLLLSSDWQSPPHTPMASSSFPSQSHTPAGIPGPPQTPHSSKNRQLPSSSTAFGSKLHAVDPCSLC